MVEENGDITINTEKVNIEMNDHDLLITINQKLTDLCSQVRSGKKENKEAHERLWKAIGDFGNKSLPAKIFYWSMPFIILGLIGVAGLASTNRYELGKVEKIIELKINVEKDQETQTGGKTTEDAITESIIIRK